MSIENPENHKNKEPFEGNFDQEIIDENLRVLRKITDRFKAYEPKEWKQEFIGDTGMQFNVDPDTGRIMDPDTVSNEDYKNLLVLTLKKQE